MAKCRPRPTLEEMETELGYKIDFHDPVKRFYSDLRPVSDNVYERTREEFEAYKRRRMSKGTTTLEEDLLGSDGVYTIQDTVTFTRMPYAGLYTFAVDIHYPFGFSLPMLFNQNETSGAMAIAKLEPNTTPGLGSTFSKLPKELRDKIYTFALPRGEWRRRADDDAYKLTFARGIGDLSGFYFPLSSLTVLRVSRQMRQEALPFAYRMTIFHLDDMDDLIKLLIAIGDIGRNNITSLELAWESRADSEYQWAKAAELAADVNEFSLNLPTLHTAKCVQLLKQCKSLSFLRLYFEKDIISGNPPLAETDPGICGLSSVRGIKRVEICDLGHQPLEECGFVKWLKGEMESSSKEEKDLTAAGRFTSEPKAMYSMAVSRTGSVNFGGGDEVGFIASGGGADWKRC